MSYIEDLSLHITICTIVHVHLYFICVCSCVRYDSRVKAMEVDEKPTETYSDIGGLDKQIEEVNNNRKSMYM